jgi:O-antigen/teichoic acid export membrane protein
MEVSRSFPKGAKKAIWSKASKWVSRGTFAVIDQAFISGAHFVLGIYLARYLNQESYGAYALAFSVLSLLATLHQAIVLEPQSVFGGAKYRSSLKNYLGRLLGLQTVSSIASLLILFAAAAVVYVVSPSREVTLCLLGAAVATPSSLLLAFTRRALYLEYRSRTAAMGAVLYSVLLFFAVWLLRHLGWFSALTAFLGMAGAALLASVLLLVSIGPERSEGVYRLHVAVLREHWHYGRWALGSSIFTWISWNSWYTIVGSSSGLADAGALKALLNLVMPVTQSCAALSLLVLPHTSYIAHAEGWAGAKRQAIRVGSLFTAGAALYWAVILMFRVPLIGFLYTGKYDSISNHLPLLALSSVLSSTIFGPVSALRALQKPAMVCLTFLLSSVAGLCIGIPASRVSGIGGAVSGMLLSSTVALSIAALLLIRAKPTAMRCATPDLGAQIVP